MTKEDFIRKFTSRKMWAAISVFVAGLLAFFGVKESVVVQVTGLIMSGGAMISYILAEGWVDAAGAHADQTVTYLTADDWEPEPEEKPPEEEEK